MSDTNTIDITYVFNSLAIQPYLFAVGDTVMISSSQITGVVSGSNEDWKGATSIYQLQKRITGFNYMVDIGGKLHPIRYHRIKNHAPLYYSARLIWAVSNMMNSQTEEAKSKYENTKINTPIVLTRREVVVLDGLADSIAAVRNKSTISRTESTTTMRMIGEIDILLRQKLYERSNNIDSEENEEEITRIISYLTALTLLIPLSREEMTYIETIFQYININGVSGIRGR